MSDVIFNLFKMVENNERDMLLLIKGKFRKKRCVAKKDRRSITKNKEKVSGGKENEKIMERTVYGSCTYDGLALLYNSLFCRCRTEQWNI